MKLGTYSGKSVFIGSDEFDFAKFNVIIETDQEVDLSMPISHEGKTYYICGFHSKKSIGILREIEMGEGEEKPFKDFITCPYCGHEDHDSWARGEENEEEVCGLCGGTFSYQKYVEVSYSTRPVKAPEVKEL